MRRAKVTSKGQVTIPVEVRNALGVKQGDILAFETQADYVVVRRLGHIKDVSAAHRKLTSASGPAFANDDDAVSAYFDDLEPDDLSETPIVIEPRVRYGDAAR